MLDVCNEINTDLDWRERELAALKSMLYISKNEAQKQALLRAAWVMLYAHYEGFAKNTWEKYLQVIERSELPIRRLSPLFLRLCLEPLLRSSRPKEDAPYDKLVEFGRSGLDKLLDSPIKFEKRLPTYNNLYPNTFRENCQKIGLSFEKVNEFQTELKLLVVRRNGIAHGGKNFFDEIQELTRHETAVLTVLTELAVEVINSIEQNKHLARLIRQ